MDIKINNAINFQRRLKPKEEGDYSAVLKQAKEKNHHKKLEKKC